MSILEEITEKKAAGKKQLAVLIKAVDEKLAEQKFLGYRRDQHHANKSLPRLDRPDRRADPVAKLNARNEIYEAGKKLRDQVSKARNTESDENELEKVFHRHFLAFGGGFGDKFQQKCRAEGCTADDERIDKQYVF